MSDFLIRFLGGPEDGGQYQVRGPWPPPDLWPVEPGGGGTYRLETRSQLPDEVADHPNIMRGAQYVWVEE